jgi:AcrR family transcriptional regulator
LIEFNLTSQALDSEEYYRNMSTVPSTAIGRRIDDVGTRVAIQEAAVECVLREGFYRASASAIARQAGVTWGSIQYYFGTREMLLLSVLERDFKSLIDRVDAAGAAESLYERIDLLGDVVYSYYSRREYSAIMQIHMNLRHDPQARQGTLDALVRLEKGLVARWRKLVGASLAPDATLDPGFDMFIFAAFRGLGLGTTINLGMPEDIASRVPVSTPDAHRRHLVDAIHALIADQAR